MQRTCPHCGKVIAPAAIRCVWCREDLAPISGVVSSAPGLMTDDVPAFSENIRRFLAAAGGLVVLALVQIWIESLGGGIAFFLGGMLGIVQALAVFFTARFFVQHEGEIVDACAEHASTRWVVGVACLLVGLAALATIFFGGVGLFFSRRAGLFPQLGRQGLVVLVAIGSGVFFVWRGVAILRAG
jgi:hypothetical protein